jgi:hypothetical protein
LERGEYAVERDLTTSRAGTTSRGERELGKEGGREGGRKENKDRRIKTRGLEWGREPLEREGNQE